MKWFRFYDEFMDDPKIAMMSDSDQLLWVKALCLANNFKPRGTIPLLDNEIAWRLRVSDEKWIHAVDSFKKNELILDCSKGYLIANWDSLQHVSYRLPADEWKVIRERIFYRDKYTCQYCGAVNEPLQCDHVFPVSRGGSNDESNLVTACKPCNLSKHAKTPEEWGGRS
jgi:hypothetical protein